MVNSYKYKNRVTLNLSDKDIEFLDSLIHEEKMFMSRTDCIRTLIRELRLKIELKKEQELKEQQIKEQELKEQQILL